MAVKHTPAPWQSNTWKHEYARDGFETVITDSRGHGIVSFHQYGESEKVTANARLIAESPTMFEALQAVAALDWFPHSDDPGECLAVLIEDRRGQDHGPAQKRQRERALGEHNGGGPWCFDVGPSAAREPEQ